MMHTSHFLVIAILPSGGEWFWIGLVALFLFGPDKLPEIARMAGRWMGELQRAKHTVQEQLKTIEQEIHLPAIDIRPAASTRAAQLPLPASFETQQPRDPTPAGSPAHYDI